MFQNWIKFLHLKSADSALKCSETQVRVAGGVFSAYLENIFLAFA